MNTVAHRRDRESVQSRMLSGVEARSVVRSAGGFSAVQALKKLLLPIGLTVLILTVLVGAYPGTAGANRVAATLKVSTNHCAPNWQAQRAGIQSYVIDNVGVVPLRIAFLAPRAGWIFGEIQMLAPGTSLPLELVVPAGNYEWTCTPIPFGETLKSPIRKVAGSTSLHAHPFLPLTAAEVRTELSSYREIVASDLVDLVKATDALQKAVDSGDLSEARTLWLPAHLDYARIGVAYGAFGAFNTEIDGRADGLQKGVADPHFTGFLRLEYGLWHHQSAVELRPVARYLDQVVHKLDSSFPTIPIQPLLLPQRAHEVLENALEFELTGDTNEGSNSNLATTFANVQATESILGVLAPALRLRDPGLLKQLTSGLTALGNELTSFRSKTGVWRSLASLGRPKRELVDSMTGALLEQLALLPDVLQVSPASQGDPD